MATETEVIRDFIARLGFTIDKSAESRFHISLGSLAKTAAAVATGLVAASAAIVTSVVAISSKFDQLYFAAQRTNSTIQSIKSLGYALSQVGGSAEQALSLLDGISSAIRTNPGNEGLLNSLGVSTRENGQLRETSKILDDLMAKLPNKHDYYVTQQIATSLGIPDERTWQTLVTHWEEIKKFREEFSKTSSSFGVDPEKAAEASNKLMTSFRSLMNTVEVMVQKLAIDLQEPIEGILNDLSRWIETHQEDIVKAINLVIEAVRGLVEIFSSLVTAVQPAIKAMDDLASKIGGGNNSSVKTALEGILIFMAASWVPKMLKFLSAVRGPWAGLLGLLAMSYLGGGAPGSTLAGMAGVGQKELGPGQVVAPVGNNDPMAQNLGPMQGLKNGWKWLKNKFGVTDSSSGGSESSEVAPRGDLTKVYTKNGKFAWVHKDYAPQFQGFIKDLEATGYQIDDIGGFAERANVNNPGQWSQHAFGRAIDINPGKNPNGTTQTDLPPQTAELAKKWGLGWGMNWRSTKDPMHFSGGIGEGGRLMSKDELDKLIGLPQKQSAIDNSLLGGSSSSRMATLTQRTEVQILGSTDPASTASIFGREQNRINAELLRDAQTAFT